ncbi:MAG: response regulator [Verrucomicrobiota bacterium]|jgi:two-component system cell cycle response regulator
MSVKILVIDDSEIIRLIVTRAFKLYDCIVLEAENGEVGLTVASREKPDLILLDYMMPVLDGYGTLTRLRSDADLKSTPVIMLTAEAGRDTVIKIAQLGVRGYLVKPFKGELLVERVGRVVELKLKSPAAQQGKRFDDPIGILVVDDKPAIPAQVTAGLADTSWKVTSAGQQEQALDHCLKNGADLVLASLSLPKDGAFALFQNLRTYSATASIPVLGMCVRTAAAEQSRAQQNGFAGVINKPIDCAELKAKICRTLALETSYKYFQQRDGILALMLPKDFHPALAQEVSAHLQGQLVGTVDAGGDKLIIDLTPVETASLPIIEFVLSAIQAASKLSLRCAIVGSDATQKQCRSFAETQAWLFAGSFEQALALLK